MSREPQSSYPQLSIPPEGRAPAAGILAAWLDATDDAAIAIDAAGAVVLHNPAASRVTGLAPELAIARPWRDVVRLDSSVADRLWVAGLAGRRVNAVVDVLCAQGNLRSTDIIATPWRDSTGGIGILLLIRDLAILCGERVGPAGGAGYGNLVGRHPSMRALYDLIDVVAPSDAPVLIEGERGVEKELVAQLVHARSRRAERPLIAVDCRASALEAELRGRARGAAADAMGSVIGRFELAHTGSLFLDEVGEMSPAAQEGLLGVLETGGFERLGDPTRRRVDFRLIATSTRPLRERVGAGRFREDLHHRIKVVTVTVPPLRDRLSDLPLLVDHLLTKHAPPGTTLSPAALALLASYAWPGNVRQLSDAIRQAVDLLPPSAERAPIGPELLPLEIQSGTGGEEPSLGHAAARKDDRRALLLRALSAHGGNRSAAARTLGIGRATFYRWWREAGLADAAPDAPA